MSVIPSAICHIVFVLLLYLLAGCSGESKEQAKKTEKKQTKALALISNDDCLNCHNIEDKSVGPSYVQVAQRYEADFSTVNRLANKIIEGGGGLWGGGQMTKHPFLKKEDAKRIVRWILSLDDTTAHQDPMMATAGIMLADTFQGYQKSGETGNGLVIKAYTLEEMETAGTDGFPEIPQDATPLHAGIIKLYIFPRSSSSNPYSRALYYKSVVLSPSGSRANISSNRYVPEKAGYSSVEKSLSAGMTGI